MGDRIPLDQAAQQLGVSRRRAQAMVTANTLPAEKVGGQWLVPTTAIQFVKHTRVAKAGHPLSPAGAWTAIRQLDAGNRPTTSSSLDLLRRRLQPRAARHQYYVHPALLDDLRQLPEVVLSGRDAAVDFGAPVDRTTVDAYVRDRDVGAVEQTLRARPVIDRANAYLHAVPDDVWPFGPNQRTVSTWVAWLDLEDRQDRAAVTLLDRIIGGRLDD